MKSEQSSKVESAEVIVILNAISAVSRPSTNVLEANLITVENTFVKIVIATVLTKASNLSKLGLHEMSIQTSRRFLR